MLYIGSAGKSANTELIDLTCSTAFAVCKHLYAHSLCLSGGESVCMNSWKMEMFQSRT